MRVRQHESLEAGDQAVYNNFEFVEGDEDTLAALRQCLKGLTAREREIVLLHHGEGATYKLVAVRIGITVANARKIACLVRDRLRQCMQQKVKYEFGTAADLNIAAMKETRNG